MPDEIDLQLANLLQIDPRMPWVQAGEILGISATTAATRWKRLTENGLAWIVVYPNLVTHFTALVEIDCQTETLPGVIQELCRNRFIVSVDESTGRRDILVWVITPDMATMSSVIIDWIGSLDGVYGARTSLVTEVVSGVDAWRVNALTPRQISQANANRVPCQPPGRTDAADVALAEALALDGRASGPALAEQLGEPVSTTRRRLARLRATRQIIMHCDLAPELSGQFLECTWLATIAPSNKQRVRQVIQADQSIRHCLYTTGTSNFRFTFGVSNPGNVAGFESRIVHSLPELAPEETLFCMRHHKSLGRLIGADGRATTDIVVPVFDLHQPGPADLV